MNLKNLKVLITVKVDDEELKKLKDILQNNNFESLPGSILKIETSDSSEKSCPLQEVEITTEDINSQVAFGEFGIKTDNLRQELAKDLEDLNTGKKSPNEIRIKYGLLPVFGGNTRLITMEKSFWEVETGDSDLNIKTGEKIPTNTHIAFANSKKGEGFSLTQTSGKYIGTYISDSSISSTDPKSYKWRKI